LWKESRTSLFLALIHCLTFDLACYYIYSGNNLGFAIQVAIICICVAWPLFYLISWANKYAIWIYASLFTIDGLAAYFVWTYKLELRADTLALMYESNLQEARAFIGFPLIAWLSICIGSVYLMARKGTKSSLSLGSRFKIFLTLLLIATLSYRVFKHIDYRMPKPLPTSLIQESQRYFKEKSRLKKMLATKINISNTITKAPEDKPTIVLVIGESARVDHFSLNGYTQETNPELKKRDVLSYSKVTSCGNQTRISVPCMLTRNTVTNHENLLKETSLISLFRAAGFATAWYSNQRVMHENDTVTTSIANEAETLYFTKLSYNNARDEYLLPKINEFISSENGPKMLVVHTIGSHWSYDHRYDPAHEIFKPVCHDSTQWTCSAENLTNTYDNSILYTDWFLSTIIDSLKDKNALLIYVSDHGESLGEDGFFSHGQDEFRAEQRSVPLIMWASEQYKKGHLERYQAAEGKLTQELNHDVIFHSMLDCAGIESPVIDKNLSLCNTLNR
jgi:glucan phosphoethanolaminetransferase (alkaline phosphatase superfamily)